MDDKERTALLVAPHPDDVELSMGGTILQMIHATWRVILVDLTDGEPTPFGSPQIRARETERASVVLGVQHRICLGMPNRSLEVTLENRRALAEVIRLHRPDVLFGPYGSDLHPDHAEASRLMDASRFDAKLHKTDMPGEPHWTRRFYRYHPLHTCCPTIPSFVIDVTEVWDRKLAAICAYASQLKNRGGNNAQSWLDRTEVLGRYFGQLIGCKYGEAFYSQDPLGSEALSLLSELSI